MGLVKAEAIDGLYTRSFAAAATHAELEVRACPFLGCPGTRLGQPAGAAGYQCTGSVASPAAERRREGVALAVSGAFRVRVFKLASSSTKVPEPAVRCRGTGALT